MKTPTPWSNNDVKAPIGWSPSTKAPALFSPSTTKQPTQYTAATKQRDAWGPTQHDPQNYFYNDSNITYNSIFFNYNNMVNNNTDNQRLVTRWAAA